MNRSARPQRTDLPSSSPVPPSALRTAAATIRTTAAQEAPPDRPQSTLDEIQPRKPAALRASADPGKSKGRLLLAVVMAVLLTLGCRGDVLHADPHSGTDRRHRLAPPDLNENGNPPVERFRRRAAGPFGREPKAAKARRTVRSPPKYSENPAVPGGCARSSTVAQPARGRKASIPKGLHPPWNCLVLKNNPDKIYWWALSRGTTLVDVETPAGPCLDQGGLRIHDGEALSFSCCWVDFPYRRGGGLPDRQLLARLTTGHLDAETERRSLRHGRAARG